MLPGIVLLGLLLRGAPWLRANNFTGVLEYDDGVYYGAAKFLLHGLMPYRDFTIVHPPAICVLLLPFAAIGNWLGDPVGMGAARLAMLVVFSCNTVHLCTG